MSPIKVFEEVMRKTTPARAAREEGNGNGNGNSHPMSPLSRVIANARRGSVKFSSGRRGGSANNSSNNNNNSSKQRGGKKNSPPTSPTTSPTGGRDDGGDDDDGSAFRSIILDDEELTPGLVLARSKLPPWAVAASGDVANLALQLNTAVKKRKRAAMAVKKSPRFARTTEQYGRRHSNANANANANAAAAAAAAAAAHGGAVGVVVATEGEALDPNDKTLEQQTMLFSHQLRPEDRGEIAARDRALKEQRRRHIHETILARLAPADREARLADRERLAPFRRDDDRELPFPDQAATDRMLAARHRKLPQFVAEGQQAIDYVTSGPKWNSGAASAHRVGGGGGGGGGGAGGESPGPMLFSSLGMSGLVAPGGAGGAGGSGNSPRPGSGGLGPAEGSPRPKNPPSRSATDERLSLAALRHEKNERDLHAKVTRLDMTIHAKQARAEAKKTMIM